MTTMLPAGKLTPVPVGTTSWPWPGAQAVSQGVFEIWASPVPGRAVSPKHVQPLPPSSAAGPLGQSGGTRNRMAWWTSTLFGKKWLATMNELASRGG